MKNLLRQLLIASVLTGGWISLGSWIGGPSPDCKNDSLAIVRVVTPISKLFDIKPVVFISKGACKIDEISVSDAQYGDGDLILKQTLTNFLTNGYTIQTATETVDNGMQLNTYYLKKKAI